MKNYVLCTTLDEDSINTLKTLNKDIDLSNAKLHILTVIEKQIYSADLAVYAYPVEAQFPAIETSATNLLKSVGEALGINPANVMTKCFFEFDREKTIKQYLELVKADLVIVATRGKHGLDGFFSSSFTDYLCKFSPCDVLVMRPRK